LPATLAIYISCESAERAREVIEHGTLIPFVTVHQHDLAMKVIEDDEEDALFV